jgi:hypothetical protein
MILTSQRHLSALRKTSLRSVQNSSDGSSVREATRLPGGGSRYGPCDGTRP